jgi:gamma-glutamyltranspeptidase/glutathione hydrolase
MALAPDLRSGLKIAVPLPPCRRKESDVTVSVRSRPWLALAAVVLLQPAAAADLSPAAWPLATRAQLQQREYFGYPAYPATVQGGSVLVTGTLSPVAVHAGIEALRQGGTAVDAAATVALTQIATDFGAVVSYAGITQLLYFDARTRKVYSLDAPWGSYAQETDPASIPATDLGALTGAAPQARHIPSPGRQTLVGGFMAGIEAMHRRFGRLPFADLFEPAIWYAEQGVVVSPRTAGYFQMRGELLMGTPEGRAFAGSSGRLPVAGDLLKQPELAHTLREVAAQGASYLYTGEWAQRFVAAVARAGGRVTLADLARYQPVWHEPLSVTFAGATVFGPGEVGSGPCSALAALNLLEALHVENQGPYWRDPVAFKAYAQALRLAQLGPYLPQVSAFETSNGFSHDCKARLSPEYAKSAAPQLESLLSGQAALEEAGHHTQAVVVVDQAGNIAALVHSINALIWGDTGIIVGGVPIPDAAAINGYRLVHLPPGAQVPADMSPLIALRQGRPVLAIATVGSSLAQETVRLVAGALAGKADSHSLMGAPPLLLDLSPVDASAPLSRRPEPVPARAYDPALLKGLSALGLPAREVSLQTLLATRGTAVMVMLDPPGGAPRAVEVRSVPGFAESPQRRASRQVPTVPLQVLDRYVGDYRSGQHGVIRIRREGSHLFSLPTSAPRVELFPDSLSQFHSRVSDSQWSFHMDEAGTVSELIEHHGGLTGPDTVAIPIREVEDAQLQARSAADAAPAATAAAPAGGEPGAVDATGDWTGALTPSVHLAFHIRRGEHGYEATGDSLDQGAFGFPVQEVKVEGDTLSLSLTAVAAHYQARWEAATGRWIGQWQQPGVSLPLSLVRGTGAQPSIIAGLDGIWRGTYIDSRGEGPQLQIETGEHGTVGRLALKDQRLFAAPLSSLARNGRLMRASVPSIGATIEGELSADGRTITGSFGAFGVTRAVVWRRETAVHTRSP